MNAPRVLFMLVSLLVGLLIPLPEAEAEQYTWQFAVVGGGLGTAVDVSASLTFPNDPVPKGSIFTATGFFVTDDTNLDVVVGPVTSFGCDVTRNDVEPSTSEAPWVSFNLTIVMEGPECTIQKNVTLMNEAQTTAFFVHNFGFTVESFLIHEFGQDPGVGFFNLFFPVAFFVMILLMALQTGNVFWFIPGTLGALLFIGSFTSFTISFVLVLIVLGFAFPFLKSMLVKVAEHLNPRR